MLSQITSSLSRFFILMLSIGLLIGPPTTVLAFDTQASQMHSSLRERANEEQSPLSTSSATPAIQEAPAVNPRPVEIFANLSPSIAFVKTASSTGSGILLEDGYVLTNAHIVWPFTEVRLVFPDGTEFKNAKVIGWDFMVDLAIIGPLDTTIQPISFADFDDANNYLIGSDVYLIGYPGEFESFPQPTFSRGILSRLRKWASLDMTFVQSDSPVVGGQSGGILISERGKILGISGWIFASEFALATSSIDILPRVETLIEGGNSDGLEENPVPTRGRQRRRQIELDHIWDTRVFVLNEAEDTEIELQANSDSDILIRVVNNHGSEFLYIDDEIEGLESGSFITEFAVPYFVIVEKWEAGTTKIDLTSSHRLALYEDANDGLPINIGETISAKIDYPGDVDYFWLELEEGESVQLFVDSIAIDPYLAVDVEDGDGYTTTIFDDDSGGGLFGLNAKMTYKAEEDNTYLVVIQDSISTDVGGYVLSVEIEDDESE